MRLPTSRLCFILALGCFCPLMANTAQSEPLHLRIDRLTSASRIGPASQAASDAEFLRRAYLDLTGVIPTVVQARTFLDDSRPVKRALLVDELLASEAYARHMTNVFDVMFMERRADKYVKADQWRPYLLESFRQNKPFSQLAAEILAADAADAAKGAAAKFYLARELEPNLLTREVGRVFFGMDLECAQCHDHPLIDDYHQSDFYGIYAFLQRSYLFQPDKKKPAVIAEKPEGDANFKSVFTEEEGSTRPRLPGSVEIDEPTFAKGQEWQVPPNAKDKKIRPIPKFSRRAELAKLATNGSNRAFNRNIANRLWAHMMGRGVVQAVDLHHSDNPPANPKLLDLLAAEMVSMKFDIRGFLRELALTEAYQKPFQVPPKIEGHVPTAKQQLAAAESQWKQQQDAIEALVDKVEQLDSAVAMAKRVESPLRAELKKAHDALPAAQKAASDATAAHAPLQKQFVEKDAAAKAVTGVAQSTAIAAQKLPGDQQVVQAAAQLQTRVQQLAAEVAVLAKTVAEKKTAMTAASQKVTELQSTIATVTAKADAARQQMKSQQQLLVTARTESTATKTLANNSQQRIAGIKALIGYAESSRAVAPQAAAMQKLQAELTAARAALQAVQTRLAKSTSELAVAREAQAKAAQLMADAGKKAETAQQSVAIIEQAAAAAVAAAQKIAGDAQLADATQKLKARQQEYAVQMVELQKTAQQRTVEVDVARKRMASAEQSLQQAKTAMEAANSTMQTLATNTNKASKEIEAAREGVDAAYDDLSGHLASNFEVAVLEQLTPEQLAMSTMQVVGLVDRYRAAAEAELNKKTPLKPEEQKDPKKLAERAKQIENETYKKLQGTIKRFVQLFAAAPGQPQHDFFASVEQALFYRNGGEIRGWLAPSGDNLTQRMIKLEDPAAIAEEAYLSVLTRRPTGEEAASVAGYLASRPKEKNVVVQEIVWALLSSAEFRFHH